MLVFIDALLLLLGAYCWLLVLLLNRCWYWNWYRLRSSPAAAVPLLGGALEVQSGWIALGCFPGLLVFWY